MPGLTSRPDYLAHRLHVAGVNPAVLCGERGHRRTERNRESAILAKLIDDEVLHARKRSPRIGICCASDQVGHTRRVFGNS